jgi:hypothetical protein
MSFYLVYYALLFRLSSLFVSYPMLTLLIHTIQLASLTVFHVSASLGLNHVNSCR